MKWRTEHGSQAQRLIPFSADQAASLFRAVCRGAGTSAAKEETQLAGSFCSVLCPVCYACMGNLNEHAAAQERPARPAPLQSGG